MISIGASRSEAFRSFFDRDVIVRSMNREQRRFLAQFGAFTRTTARRSMRRRKGVSSPGSPPNSHTGLLRDNVFFYAETGSVVIGPTRLNARSAGTAASIPQILEEGGTVTRKGKTLNYEPRPFMGPAFAKAKDQQDRFWTGTLKR